MSRSIEHLLSGNWQARKSSKPPCQRLRDDAASMNWPRGPPQFAEQADKEGWPAARFLSAIAEHELSERDRRRIERHLADARLPPGKTIDSFDFDVVPMISKAQVMAITAGDAWIAKGANVLMFGPPGGGKSHLAAAIGLALIENGWRVLFTRTTELVQKLQVARRELQLESAINKLERFDLLILDDLAYVTSSSGFDFKIDRGQPFDRFTVTASRDRLHCSHDCNFTG